MTSEGSTRVVPSYGVVSSAKAALESHIRQLAMELARSGIGRDGQLHPRRRHRDTGPAQDPRVADDDRHHDEAEPDRPDDDAAGRRDAILALSGEGTELHQRRHHQRRRRRVHHRVVTLVDVAPDRAHSD